MSDRTFRFGLVAGQAESGDQWTGLARRVEDAGYDVLLLPDTPNVISPFPALAMAAAATSTLRLGTFVLNAPLRAPGSIAWDAASVDRLSGGRFELGIGAGRPDGRTDADRLGLPWGTPGERVTRLAETIDTVRATFAEAAKGAPGGFGAGVNHLAPVQERVPVMVAGGGNRILGLAARQADIVAFGGAAGERDLAERIALVRDRAGERFAGLELSTNIFAVGDGPLPGWLTAQFGIDPERARDNQLLAVLNGDTDEMCEILRRRRDTYGISYVTVNAMAMERFQPVLERLSGK